MNFNPEILDECAAFLFWSCIEHYHVEEVREAILATGGLFILKQENSNKLIKDILRDENITISVAEFEALKEDIATYAFLKISEDEQIIGRIFLDEIKSPYAQTLDTKIVNFSPKKINQIRAIEKCGTLLLRSPLPSIAFCDHAPDNKIIQIKDTVSALGFNLTLYLSCESIQPVQGGFILIGLFLIPVPTEQVGDLWDKLIPNSHRVINNFNIYRENTKDQINFEW